MAAGMKIGDLFVRLGMDLSEFSKGFELAQKELEAQSKLLSDTGASMTKAITLPLAGIAGASLAAFGGFEQSMNRVSALGDIFGKDLEKLNGLAMELGAKTQYSAKQAADAMGNLAAAGFKTNEIYSAMPGVLALAATENMKIADAAQIAADVLKGFQLQAQDMQMVADVLAKTSAASSNSVRDLGYAFSYVGPVAKAVGMDFLDVAASLGVLGDAGIRGERGGTALRNIINDLIAPSSKAAEVMARLGIHALDANGKLKPMKDLIAELQPLTTNTSAAVAIFGQRWSEVVPILAKGGKAFAEMRKEVSTFEGAAKKMADIIRQGVAGNLEEFTSSLETVGIQIGKTLAPLANQLLQFGTQALNAIGNMAEQFGKLPGPVKTFTIAILGLAAVTGPLLVFAGSLTGALANLKLLPAALSAAGSLFTQFGTSIGGSSTALTSLLSGLKSFNVGDALTGLKTALTAIGTGVIDGVKNIPTALSTAANAFKTFGSTAVTALSANAKLIATGFASMSGSILAFVQTATSVEGIKGALSAMSGAFSAVVTTITGGGGLMGAFSNLRMLFMGFAPLVVGFTASLGTILVVGAAVAAIAYTLYKNWDDVKAVFVAFWNDISRLVASAGKFIMGWIESTFGKAAAGYIAQVWQGLVTFFKNVWDGIVSVFQNGLKWILEGASSVAKAFNLEETSRALDNWRRKLDDVGGAIQIHGTNANTAFANIKTGLVGAGNAAEFMGTKGDGAFSKIAGKTKKAHEELTVFEKKMKDVERSFDKVKDLTEDLPNSMAEYSKKVNDEGFNGKAALKRIEEAWRDIQRQIANETDPTVQSHLKTQAVLLGMARSKLTELNAAWNEMDLEKARRELDSVINGEMWKSKPFELPNFLDPLKQAEEQTKKVKEQFEALGLTFDEIKYKSGGQFTQLTYDADKALEAYTKLRDSGLATTQQLQDGWIKYLEKKVAAENEANSKIVFSGKNALGFISANLSQSVSEFQLATAKAVQGFSDSMSKGIKDSFSKLFSGDFSGFAAALPALGKTFLKGVEEVMFAPFKAQMDKFLSNMASGIGKWVAENVLGVLGKGFNVILGQGNAVSNLFSKLFGGSSVVDAGKAAVDAGKAAGAAAQIASSAGKTASDVAAMSTAAAKTATEASKASVQAAGAVTDASKAATTAAKGALSSLQSVIGTVSGIVSAVTGVLSYLQGRRMEQDIGRIEVTTRGQLNVLLQTQQLQNKFLPKIGDFVEFFQGVYITAFASLMTTTEAILSRIDELVRLARTGIAISGGNVDATVTDPVATIPGGGGGATTGLTGVALTVDARNREIKAINDGIAAEQTNSATTTDNTAATSENTFATTTNTQAQATGAASLRDLSAAQDEAAKTMDIGKDVWARLKDMSDEEIKTLAKGSADTENFLTRWRAALKKGAEKTEDLGDSLEGTTKTAVSTTRSFDALDRTVAATATSFSDAGSGVKAAAQGLYVDVSDSFRDVGNALADGAEKIKTGMWLIQDAFDATEAQILSHMKSIEQAGGDYATMRQQLAALQQKLDSLRGGSTAAPNTAGVARQSGPNYAPTVPYWGAPLSGISSTPIMQLNVTVNNADAQQVGNTIVSTLRTRGVDI